MKNLLKEKESQNLAGQYMKFKNIWVSSEFQKLMYHTQKEVVQVLIADSDTQGKCY